MFNISLFHSSVFRSIGFRSIVNPYFTYLTAIDDGVTCFTHLQVAEMINADPVMFANKYNKG